MTNTNKIAVSIVEDRILADLNRRSSASIRKRLLEMFEEAHCPRLDVVENVAAKHADCPHLSMTGDEGPIDELGRFPLVWKCDSCGARIHSEPCS